MPPLVSIQKTDECSNSNVGQFCDGHFRARIDRIRINDPRAVHLSGMGEESRVFDESLSGTLGAAGGGAKTRYFYDRDDGRLWA